ncbi:UdgX family uracil-DNA binding protein [Phenylobacterium sp.]|uniref:UdgX family uracil-DNA binding protein n=1 Tax=Phenylobacterium sp. TaxID=1871053 RepID=UPI002ED937C0
MEVVRLAHETDFDGWRAAARALRARAVAPADTLWTVDDQASPFAVTSPPEVGGEGALALHSPPAGSFTVPKGFVELAERVILHRSDERFALLYRLLWRLQDQPGLLRIASDPDVALAAGLARDVDKAAHKMKAFVRFCGAYDDQGEAFVAWFEPAHRVVEATAPFFVRRFANTRWSILTPDVCAHWTLAQLTITPGADPADAPRVDQLESHWKARYAAIFDPRRNPPEGAPIPERVRSPLEPEMVAKSEPSRRVVKAAIRNSRDAPWDGVAPTTLDEVAAGVDHCRRCDLWRDATQGVAGEGPRKAKLLFVGEQPGDQEDLAGRPFVGPAGQVFDKALAEAGVPRAETYVTNAVKHFKHELRGKRRIHQTPTSGEVTACRWWLDAERRIIRPRVIVSLGATAALAVFGKATPVGKFRQQALQLSDQAQGVVTYHPSYLLRVPDAEAKAKAYAAFVEDLKFAWKLAA